MRLTRKKAIELCIELWTWLAGTGEEKRKWPGWEENDRADNECWFCEYDRQQGIKHRKYTNCFYCPLKSIGEECGDSFYVKWENAKTSRTRKKYAKLFLNQIESIAKERENENQI